MFTRESLGHTRAKLTEVFHTAADQAERERAFSLILKINERLLRGSWRTFEAHYRAETH